MGAGSFTVKAVGGGLAQFIAITFREHTQALSSLLDSVPGSAWDGTFRKLCFRLRASKQSFGGVRSLAEPENEWKRQRLRLRVKQSLAAEYRTRLKSYLRFGR